MKMPKTKQQKKNDREYAIACIMEEKGWSYCSAEQYYMNMCSNKPVATRLKEIMKEFDCPMSTAKYIHDKEKKGLPYTPHKNHYSKISYEDVKDIDPNDPNIH